MIQLSEKRIELSKKGSVIETAGLLFLQLRPIQWTKNLLVFGALLFSSDSWNIRSLEASVIAFFLFCFVSSCVYILNDFVDRKADLLHPEKGNRPIASGRLSPVIALTFGAMLLTISLFLGFQQNLQFGIILSLYFIVNVSYSLKLKHIVILDLMIIAAGFVMRAFAGVLVIQTSFTPWFLMCAFLLSLFLAIGKRRHELLLFQNNSGSHRKVLDNYSETLLNQMSGIVTTMTIMSYSLYTFQSGHSIYLMWTIPCVIYGMFRYLYLIHVLGKGGKPERLLYGDKGILACVMLFSIAIVVILKFSNGTT